MRILVLSLLAGCTGFSLGENTPGGDTWTDPPPTLDGEHHVGAIGVERDASQAWVVHEATRGTETRATLSAIDPATGASTEVLDVTGTTDRRVVFPAVGRMLLMAQRGATENLVLFDTTTRTRIASAVAPTWFWGTRTAPTGRAVVVADNQDPHAPLHVIDTTTLHHQVIPHGGDEIEAMWNHHADVLIALSVTDPFGAHPSAKLLRYDLTGADLDQPLPAPTVATELAGYGWDFAFSFTWIGISPDDHWAVFPLIHRTAGGDDGEHVLLVLDQTTGQVSLVAGSGPVGFTADSAQIVTYGAAPQVGGQPFHEDPWLVDPVTHARTTVTMPFDAGITYFISGDYLVVAPLSSDQVVIHDLATTAEHLAVPTAQLDLHDFISSPDHEELWLETAGHVQVVGLSSGTVAPVAIPGSVGSINVAHDTALTADRVTASVSRTAIPARSVLGTTALPSPFTARPPASLGFTSAAQVGAHGARLATRRAHDGDAISLDR